MNQLKCQNLVPGDPSYIINEHFSIKYKSYVKPKVLNCVPCVIVKIYCISDQST